MKYFLGIDQGGTKTFAAVCDDKGRILGSAVRQGLIGPMYFDPGELYIKSMSEASREALSMAGLDMDAVSAVCGGLSGADWEFEYPVLKESLFRATGKENAIVLNDCMAALRGGGPVLLEDRAVICAGTSLNAAVRSRDGRELIYGWYIHPEDSGGGSLGDMALRKIMDSHIGLCGKTSLTNYILEHTSYESAEKLLIELTTNKNYRLSVKELVRPYLRALSEGDAEAYEIAERFARSLSKYVISGIWKFGMEKRETEVVYSGSVFKDNGTIITEMISSYIREKAPEIKHTDAKYEPVCGALLTLLDMEYNMVIPIEVLNEFDSSAEMSGLHRNIYKYRR